MAPTDSRVYAEAPSAHRELIGAHKHFHGGKSVISSRVHDAVRCCDDCIHAIRCLLGLLDMQDRHQKPPNQGHKLEAQPALVLDRHSERSLANAIP